MKGRRQFIRELGLGALSGAALFGAAQAAGSAAPKLDTGNGKRVRVGIIGAENSHTIGFGQMFNERKQFPGVEVVALWGETAEFARIAAEKGKIPRVVKEQRELLEVGIDALIVDHRHPKYHAAAALPFIEAGIPCFVDKPFTYRVDEARLLIEAAEKKGTPITCLSSVGYGPGVDDLARQAGEAQGPCSVVITGPAEIGSKYGGIFFYGVHIVEQLFKVFGDDAAQVRATRHGGQTTFQVEFESGRLATILITGGARQVFLSTDKGMVELKSPYEEQNQDQMYAAIVRMWQTGQEPRSHQSILRIVAMLEAMERSVLSERWELLLT